MKLMLEIDPNHVDAELLTRIGSELECGGTFRQDPLMAVRAYDAAAACPDGGQAANNLGWMFLKGKGVAQDTEKALALFRNAAERGNSIAMVNLGNYYEFAEKQDDKHAVYWYRKAADSGDEKGLFNYANMLHHGRGIRQNRKKGVFHFLESLCAWIPRCSFLHGTLLSEWRRCRARLSKGARVL
ncbi:MAG: tetratricopeptide repeat protein [Oscillospiraceae bacterium]